MRLDKDVAVPMRDGALLRANVFRPDASGKFPVNEVDALRRGRGALKIDFFEPANSVGIPFNGA